jgi:Flp pilus assembly protein CpaB
LSRIEVFAVDQTLDPANADPKVNVRELRSVTLLVSPPQAVELTSGMAEGVLQLTLRNSDDENMPAPASAPAVKETAKTPPAPGDSVHTLNIYNGTRLLTHEVRTKGTTQQEDTAPDAP